MPQPIKAYLGTVPIFDNGQSSTTYTRPSDWLTLPAAPTPQGIYGLWAVFPNDQDRNLIAVTCQAAYTVDWGDGTIQNFASNVQAEHQYDYAAISASTLSSRGYKQVLVKITPQTGQNLTYAFLANKHSGWENVTNSGYTVNWLDLNINLPNITAGARLQISEGTRGVPTMLERCNITSWGALNSAAGLFARCRSLQSVNETEWNMSAMTSIGSMFYLCEKLPALDCSNWNVSAVTSATNFLNGAVSIKSFKGKSLNFSACTSLQSFFVDCRSLEICECENWVLRTTGPLSLDSLFNSCSKLQSINLSAWNTSKVTTFRLMFSNARSWEDFSSLSGWDTSSLISLDSTFVSCGARALDLSAWNISAVTNITDLFASLSRCRSIKMPAWPAVSVTGIGTNFCNSSYNLQKFSVSGTLLNGTASTLNFSACALDSTSLNTIYGTLGSASTGTKAINVGNNPGAASDDPTIATARGWSVTG